MLLVIRHSSFVIRHSFDIRHSTFDIRHFENMRLAMAKPKI